MDINMDMDKNRNMSAVRGLNLESARGGRLTSPGFTLQAKGRNKALRDTDRKRLTKKVPNDFKKSFVVSRVDNWFEKGKSRVYS